MVFILKLILLFLIGATLGPLCDLFHVLSKTSGYPFPRFYGLAFWVPILFGSATVVLALSHVLSDKIFKRPKRELSKRQIVMGLLTFMFIYYASGFLMVSEVLKLIILGFIAFTTWCLFDRTLYGLILAIITAFFGCLVEILIIRTGHFYYNIHDVFRIPYWLPFLYMTASVAVGNLGRKLYVK